MSLENSFSGPNLWVSYGYFRTPSAANQNAAQAFAKNELAPRYKPQPIGTTAFCTAVDIFHSIKNHFQVQNSEAWV
ncbi:hypothetical protein GX51_00516 [Blastomyces parvus]|uniref:Uncharacterized protein n=1 Tax=Blastomyces parvus TaxID=2060905 RepID=A0A2B7XLK6_9EURO|nr:hypothetical protein GX51_00516 [Blastomyces parvus]